jgi:DNA polymerase III delta prime subunit
MKKMIEALSNESDEAVTTDVPFVNSFVFRPPLHSLNLFKSDEEAIRIYLGCSYNEVVHFDIPGVRNSLLLQSLENISDKYSEKRFVVSGNKWVEKTEFLFKIPGTDAIIFWRPYGFITRNTDWPVVKKFVSEARVNHSSFNESALDKVCWDERTSLLVNDVKFFSNSKHWFDKRDLPYSRSYLLYGPPGNGKTSAIRAICKYFHTAPSQFSFTGRYEDPDSEFLNWVSGGDTDDSAYDFLGLAKEKQNSPFGGEDEQEESPAIRVLLLEDIDRFFSKEEGFKTPVSFSTILNALDGVVQRKNSIIIATANHPDKIDSQVLFRPGRFDLRIPFSSPTRESIISFLKKLSCDDSISDNAISKVADLCRGHSFAFVKGIYLSAANKSFERKSLEINDVDILSSADEFISNMGKEMKSNKLGVGF